MNTETAIKICYALYHEIHPREAQAREAFKMAVNALEARKEQDDEHRRLLSWLGKFCRHIDNGDKWLTDKENLAFFKEKMKQQFGWDTD